MNAYRNFALIAVVAASFAVFTPKANAQLRIKKIEVTVSEPVEVPGLVLPIGSYVFEALEDGVLTRILSADESHIYTTLLTVPTERRSPTENPAITLKENSKGDVERIDSWFFPGDPIGNEFIYAKKTSDRTSSLKIGAFTRDIGHAMTEVVKDSITAPEYLAVHVEQAVVRSSVATGHFFKARFLVA